MNILGYMQRLGKALMLPIATLPIAGILLGVGSAHFTLWPDIVSQIMAQAGGAIFDNLPLLFALGIAVGLSKDEAGAAALAGAVGYFILIKAVAVIDPGIDLSFLGGMVVGIIAGHTYNCFSLIKLPDMLAFFGGKRLVPILTGLFCLLLAGIAGQVWPSIQNGIHILGQTIIDPNSLREEFIFGVLNRLLLPIGLHHVLNSVFWFTLGECTKITYTVAGSSDLHTLCLLSDVVTQLSVGGPLPGLAHAHIATISSEVISGDLHRFFAGDPTAGGFMAGFFPIMMFGLPAAAVAMICAVPRKKRAQVSGLLGSVAITAFLVGVTEPLEFSFVFLAPLLYAIHVLLTGLCMALTSHLGIHHGFSFSAGLIDYLLYWKLATRPFLLFPLGILFGTLYFVLFYGAIKIFNLKTLGCEEDETEKLACQQHHSQQEKVTDKTTTDYSYLARQYLKALGGWQNIQSIDACITRLRLVMQTAEGVDQAVLSALGAQGVVKLGQRNLQVILGPLAEIMLQEINKILPEEDLGAIILPTL